MKTPRSIALVVLLVAPACAGEVMDYGGSGTPDAAPVVTPDADPAAPDAPPGIAAFDVSGNTVDYVSLGVLPEDPVPSIALATVGMDPAMQTQSDAAGAFVLADVPAGNSFIFRAMPAGELFVPTTNPAVTVLDQNVTRNVYVMTRVYHDRQYTTAAVTPVANTSLIVADLTTLAGAPWTGVPLAAISLVPAGGVEPVPGISTFFMGEVDVDIALLESTAFQRFGARVLFMNVPTGTYEIRVNNLPAGGGPAETALASATTYDGGATLQHVIFDPGPGQGTPLSFAADVYPLLQKASQGGQDCASCHTAGGPAAALILNDGAAATHARLLAATGVVNLLAPAESLLLTMPLYETPPNHPNATWLDTTNLSYQKVLLWITGGAVL